MIFLTYKVSLYFTKISHISTIIRNTAASLPKSSRLSLPLHKRKDVTFADGALDVTDDGAVGIVKELNTYLRDGTSVTCTTEHLIDLS